MQCVAGDILEAKKMAAFHFQRKQELLEYMKRYAKPSLV